MQTHGRFLKGAALAVVVLLGHNCFAQPQAVPGGVMGDFNSWSKDENQLKRNPAGVWSVIRRIPPGMYQYKLKNSVFVITKPGDVLLTNAPPPLESNTQDHLASASAVVRESPDRSTRRPVGPYACDQGLL